MNTPVDPNVEAWDGERYQQRFDALAAGGRNVHGEADFVAALGGVSVLDAGCGSGRVGGELARRGFSVVGVDLDSSMLAAAAARFPTLEWIAADLAALDLGRRFDRIVMAGNVMLFVAPASRGAAVAACARHLTADGLVVCGFQLGRGYELADYDADCRAAGLELVERWATWDRVPMPGDGTYAVSVHGRPAGDAPVK